MVIIVVRMSFQSTPLDVSLTSIMIARRRVCLVVEQFLLSKLFLMAIEVIADQFFPKLNSNGERERERGL